jgi:hypothetical protein
MKIKLIKLDVGGYCGSNVMFGGERVIDESKVGFKVEDKEMEGAGGEGCVFWMIREDSEYFNMSGDEFVEKELDVFVSEKNGYRTKLDDNWNEVNKLGENYLGVIFSEDEE